MSSARVTGVGAAAAVAVAGAVVPVAFGDGRAGHLDRVAILLVVLMYAVVAAVIVVARPGNRVGRLLLAGAVAWGVGEGLLGLGVEGAVTDPGSVSGAALLGVLGTAVRGLGWLVLVLAVPLVFPDGRSAWPGRRGPVAVVATAVAAFTTATLLSPVPLEARLAEVENPIGVPPTLAPVVDALALGALGLVAVGLGIAVAGLVRRWRGGDELLHQQLLWFAAAFACPLLLLPFVATPWAEPWMFALVSLPVPAAVGVALLQRRLYDIQLVLSRTLTYVLLSGLVALLYALTVGGVGALLQEQGAPWLPWVAAGVVAVSFAPLRDALQRAVTRLTYGQWSDPAKVLAASGRRLADAADVPGLLRDLVDELGDGLGLGYVEIRDGRDRTLARRGAGDSQAVELPLVAYGAKVGALRHSPQPLREHHRRLLGDVGRQLGGVVHAAALLDTIREGQERLVLAREEERRRLRRDLHDGLGPVLAALTLQVDTLRNRRRAPVIARAGGPAEAPHDLDLDTELLRLRTGIQGAVQDVRRVVEGLRPPALDESGVDGAVRQLAASLEVGSGAVITVAAEQLGALPAAVEVAVFRVAQEALTNVVRHSGATGATVRLSHDRVEGVIRLEVVDNGVGWSPEREATGAGVGMVSMRERAEEIGGSVQVREDPAGGTIVLLILPVPAEPETGS